jgi:hypothetical protein
MRRLILAAAIGIGFASSCSGCSENSNLPLPGGTGTRGGSVGTGGSGPDGSGGSPSGGRSGGTEGGPADARPDVTDEGWELAPWNPPGCKFLRAVDLDRTVPPLIWKDCANGISGCVHLDTSPLPGHPTMKGHKLFPWFDVKRTGDTTFFSVAPIYDIFVNSLVVYELGAGPRAAWRVGPETECSLQDVKFGSRGGAALRFGHTLLPDEIVSGVLYSKTEIWNLDSASVLYVDKSITGNPGVGVYQVRFSSSLMALQISPSGFVYTWDFGSDPPKLIPRPSEIVQDLLTGLRDDEVVLSRYSADNSARSFAVRHPDGSIEDLYRKPSVWAADLLSDGNDFAWQESNESTGVLDLWTAPWTTSPASFAPRKVRTLDNPPSGLVQSGFSGEGWWVYRQSESSLRSVRLTDGAMLEAPPPAGFGWLAPHGVVNGEIWVRIFVTPGSTSTMYSIARVPIASLGTPKR